MSAAFSILLMLFGFVMPASGVVFSGVFILMGSDEQGWLWLIFTISAVVLCSMFAIVAAGGRKVAV